MKRSIWLFIAMFSCLLSSCGTDAEKFKNAVPGYWIVEQAFRDQNETQLLSGVFFQFGDDGKMLTNLPNTAEGMTDFELIGEIITQKAATPIQYNIKGISDTSLVLAMVISNTPFEIHLKKSSAPLEEPADTLELPEQEEL